MKKIIFAVLCLLLTACSLQPKPTEPTAFGCACSDMKLAEKIDTFEECVARGNKVLKTMPPRCINEKAQTVVKK